MYFITEECIFNKNNKKIKNRNKNVVKNLSGMGIYGKDLINNYIIQYYNWTLRTHII